MTLQYKYMTMSLYIILITISTIPEIIPRENDFCINLTSTVNITKWRGYKDIIVEGLYYICVGGLVIW
jgi:hypothetical protein